MKSLVDQPQLADVVSMFCHVNQYASQLRKHPIIIYENLFFFGTYVRRETDIVKYSVPRQLNEDTNPRYIMLSSLLPYN